MLHISDFFKEIKDKTERTGPLRTTVIIVMDIKILHNNSDAYNKCIHVIFMNYHRRKPTVNISYPY